MSTPNELHDEAQKLANLGHSVIPLRHSSKKAKIIWKEFQGTEPTKEQLEKWFSDPRVNGMALITGGDIFVLDVEKDGLFQISDLELPETVCSETGGGGRHYYFKMPKGLKIACSTGIMPKVDIRGEGGYVVVPPSTHSSGNTYKWIHSIHDFEIAEAPQWLINMILKKRRGKLTRRLVPHGERNYEASRWSGKLIRQFKGQEEAEAKAWLELQKWNEECCQPPLDDKELRTVYESILKKDEASPDSDSKFGGLRFSDEEGERKSKSSELIELALERCEFFHDDFDEPYARFQINGYWHNHPCKSSTYKLWLGKVYWDEYKKPVSDTDLNSVVSALSAKAMFDGEKINLHNRVAKMDGCLYYDLSNIRGEAIKITHEGWSLETTPPTLFRNYTQQNEQVQPHETGDVMRLLKYLNIASEEHQLLVLVYIISCFIPEISHPIAILHGVQGSAKSTFSKIVKMIVDPSKLEITAFPRNSAELVQQLSHHWVIYYDNLSAMQQWASDDLCRAVTGGGFSKRVLYTDDDDKIYNFKRCIGLNGINMVSDKPDLIDRSLLFELERISEEKRKTEKELWSDFRADLPYILGGIFDALTKAMELLPSIKLTKMPRMADFAEHGCAIAIALGHSQEEFERAYTSNRNEQNNAIVNEDIVAIEVTAFMLDKDEWAGTPTELFELLYKPDDKKQAGFPKAPNILSRKLNELRTNLELCGIAIEKDKDSKGTRGRLITIKKLPPSSGDVEIIPSDDSDGCDGDKTALEKLV